MSARRYLTVAEAASAEIEVRRSRFLARLEPVDTEGAARAVVEEARRTHWEARHHCSAFVVGPEADTRRSNDDGEPSGTAGMPMLEVLLGRGLTNVVGVVTRWFGGTLLGTGGLIRAYTDALVAATEAATFVEFAEHASLVVDSPAEYAGKVEHTLYAMGVAVVGVEYGARRALLRLLVPESRLEELSGVVASGTAGTARIERTGTQWAAV